jgi:hypothetical protein
MNVARNTSCPIYNAPVTYATMNDESNVTVEQLEFGAHSLSHSDELRGRLSFTRKKRTSYDEKLQYWEPWLVKNGVSRWSLFLTKTALTGQLVKYWSVGRR